MPTIFDEEDDADFKDFFNTKEGEGILERMEDKVLKKEIENFAQEKTYKKIFVEAPVNRHGSCPNCEDDWDGGDIYDELFKLDVFFMKPKETKLMAEKYGWTPENKKHFSNVIGVEFEKHEEKTNLIQCPNCRHVFNVLTGQHFVNLNEARNNLYE